MLSTLLSRRLITPLVLAVSLAVGACSDDPTGVEEDEPEVQTLTLAVGANSITISKSTGAASGPLTVPAGQSTVTATWKKADGSNETLITAADYELKIVPTNAANLTWTANGPFGGTLVTTGLASNATTTARVSLLHKKEGHEDFGPFNLTVRVQ